MIRDKSCFFFSKIDFLNDKFRDGLVLPVFINISFTRKTEIKLLEKQLAEGFPDGNIIRISSLPSNTAIGGIDITPKIETFMIPQHRSIKEYFCLKNKIYRRIRRQTLCFFDSLLDMRSIFGDMVVLDFLRFLRRYVFYTGSILFIFSDMNQVPDGLMSYLKNFCDFTFVFVAREKQQSCKELAYGKSMAEEIVIRKSDNIAPNGIMKITVTPASFTQYLEDTVSYVIENGILRRYRKRDSRWQKTVAGDSLGGSLLSPDETLLGDRLF